MCLAIPAKVVGIHRDVVEVDYGGRRKKVNSKLVRPKMGDYVLVQSGFVTEILDKEVAENALKAWSCLDEKT